MRRGSALAKVSAPAFAAALLGSAVIIGGCGDDDDDPPPLVPVYTGSFSGTITYGGADPGTNFLMVYAYKNQMGGTETGSSTYAVTAAELNGGVSYSVENLPNGSYILLAWWELDAVGGPTPGDAVAINHLVQVANGEATTGVDLTLIAGGPAWHITVSVDGGPDDVISGFANFGAYYASGVTNPPIPADSTLIMAGNPGVPPWAMITFDGSTAGTFNVTSAAAVSYETSGTMSYSTIAVPIGTVTVDMYGAVNELIAGTFDVIANVFDSSAPTGATAALTGSFSVGRAMDGYGSD